MKAFWVGFFKFLAPNLCSSRNRDKDNTIDVSHVCIGNDVVKDI